jgi:hypothetical protein
MTGNIPNFLFHVPHTNRMLNYDELEKMVKKRNAPEIVKVIDNHSKKRLGAVPPSFALIKFK